MSYKVKYKSRLDCNTVISPNFELYIPLDCTFHDASFAKNHTFLSPNLDVRGLCVSLLRLQKYNVDVVTNATQVNYSQAVVM